LVKALKSLSYPGGAVSALTTFIRIRQFRARAAEHYYLASTEDVSEDVRARYRAIGDHFTALAEAELAADKSERKRRLEKLRADRAKRIADEKKGHGD